MPSAPTAIGLAVAAEHRVAGGRGQPALDVGRELAVARVARALAGLDGEEAVAGDREVERVARLLQRLGRPVGDGAGDLDGGALGADRGAGHGVVEQKRAERPLRRAVGLVAGRRRVCEVVGDLVLAYLLGEHAGGRDVEPAIHVVSFIGADAPCLKRWTRSQSPRPCCAPRCRGCSLQEGATLMARVASRGETHAVIVLAGIPVTAQVPPEIEAGATLRLKVQEVTPERVTLRIDPAAAQQSPVVGLVAPPEPPRVRVAVDEPPARRRGGGRQAGRRRLARVHLPGARQARPPPRAARRAPSGRGDDPCRAPARDRPGGC